MSSPLRLLARQASLTPAEFQALAEDQMRSLVGGFADVHMDELRNLPCLWDGAGSVQDRAPFRDSPVVDAPHGLSTTVRGVFFKQPDDKVSYRGGQKDPGYRVARDGTVVLYGLTAKGAWILAHVEFRYDPNYQERGIHIATRMVLQESAPEKIAVAAGITPEEVAFRVWRDLAQREQKAAQAALEETLLRADGLRDRLHGLHLMSGWMGVFHSDLAKP